MTPRRPTRKMYIGSVPLGGDAPVVIQSMTSTHTCDVDATVSQIVRLASGGCDVVRVTVRDKADTSVLKEIINQSPVPIVADVHFHFERALEAIDAGVHKIRLNPGNISDRAQVDQVIAACKERSIPIRVGVNEGSIVERQDKAVRQAEITALQEDHNAELIRIMMAKLDQYLRIFEENDFHDVVLAAKSPDPQIVIDANRAISERFDYPVHLGVTHAGPPETGRIRSVSALATLLAEGIGDTLRISYASDPIHEVEDAKELLCCLGLRSRHEPELIACPTCGRLEIDLVSLVRQVRQRLVGVNKPVKVAIMGCVVNGPGEADGVDVALCAGKGKGVIYVGGRQKRVVQESEMVEAICTEVKEFANRMQGGEDAK